MLAKAKPEKPPAGTLAKTERATTSAETYAAPRIAMTRRKTDPRLGATGVTADQVDIHEMYWADLSRLSGSVPRILTELFTVLFRLSSLGRDTVQFQAAAEAYRKDRVWSVLAWLQAVLDVAYSRVLALLFLQLVMVALILVPFGLLLSDAIPLHHAASAISGMAAGLWYFYRFRKAVIALAIGAAVGVSLWIAPAAWVDGLVWIALLSVLYDWWMRVCEERFRLVRAVGWILWPISVVTVIVFATKAASNDLAMWVWGALAALEVVLLMIVFWWVLAAPVMLAWLCASFLASHRRGAGAASGAPINARAKSSVATGRVGLFVSLGFFIIITMTAWALVTTGVERAVEHVPYDPLVFKPALPAVPGDATGARPYHGGHLSGRTLRQQHLRIFGDRLVTVPAGALSRADDVAQRAGGGGPDHSTTRTTRPMADGRLPKARSCRRSRLSPQPSPPRCWRRWYSSPPAWASISPRPGSADI